MKKKILLLSIASATLALFPVQAFSLGGGGFSVSTPNCKTGYVYNSKRKKCVRKPPMCKRGYIFSRKKRKCVRKYSELFSDSDLKVQGWTLAYAGNYQAAIDMFNMVANKKDEEALNGLGYSHRKSGQFTKGISFYKLALKINPNYVLAREYLGEGFVASGRIDLAKTQLSEIKNRCGTSCLEYVKLAQVIKTGSSSNW